MARRKTNRPNQRPKPPTPPTLPIPPPVSSNPTAHIPGVDNHSDLATCQVKGCHYEKIIRTVFNLSSYLSWQSTRSQSLDLLVRFIRKENLWEKEQLWLEQLVEEAHDPPYVFPENIPISYIRGTNLATKWNKPEKINVMRDSFGVRPTFPWFGISPYLIYTLPIEVFTSFPGPEYFTGISSTNFPARFAEMYQEIKTQVSSQLPYPDIFATYDAMTADVHLPHENSKYLAVSCRWDLIETANYYANETLDYPFLGELTELSDSLYRFENISTPPILKGTRMSWSVGPTSGFLFIAQAHFANENAHLAFKDRFELCARAASTYHYYMAGYTWAHFFDSKIEVKLENPAVVELLMTVERYPYGLIIPAALEREGGKLLRDFCSPLSPSDDSWEKEIYPRGRHAFYLPIIARPKEPRIISDAIAQYQSDPTATRQLGIPAFLYPNLDSPAVVDQYQVILESLRAWASPNTAYPCTFIIPRADGRRPTEKDAKQWVIQRSRTVEDTTNIVHGKAAPTFNVIGVGEARDIQPAEASMRMKFLQAGEEEMVDFPVVKERDRYEYDADEYDFGGNNHQFYETGAFIMLEATGLAALKYCEAVERMDKLAEEEGWGER
ncbi:hypothetical protein EX30DRAFT_369009 [Ascodesmis nigricans]|uniref:Uncharacterized protein n=1 Tax=Ascodesmis nigricans TaxID=341454 RepID=A0A4S2N3Q1_9PEZI|nr:hypothetical protein EX30DRAFT_369009 [Ascodesmis nigricans]